MISSDESPDEEMLRNFDEEAELIIESDTLPKKSADRYKLVYENYKDWQMINRASLSNSEETNLVVYFKQLSRRLKPSTLWSVWSMLKKTLYTRESVDIGKFYNLKSLVKNNAKGYKPKKSLILKWDEITRFITTAPENIYLVSKVMLIFGICGALRCDELNKLKVQDVEDCGSKKFLVSINDTKTDVPRKFIIGDPFYDRVKQYMTLRAEQSFTDRFFIKFQNGKFHQQVIGRNKIGETPNAIALYLRLPNSKLYTGHCFRRTGATLLSNSGANETMLKQLGGWKSTGIAQGYVENSMKNREKIYQSITHEMKTSTQVIQSLPTTPRVSISAQLQTSAGPRRTPTTGPPPTTSTGPPSTTPTGPTPTTSTYPQPTTSNYPQPTSSSVSTIDLGVKSPMNDSTPDGEMNCDHFSDGFEINEEDLLEIETLEEPKINDRSATLGFTTAGDKKILVASNKSVTKPQHFKNKPPVKVFFKNSENTPPGHETKAVGSIQKSGIQDHVNVQKSEDFFVNENPHNSFDNCVFHGDIINNFYYGYEHSKK